MGLLEGRAVSPAVSVAHTLHPTARWPPTHGVLTVNGGQIASTHPEVVEAGNPLLTCVVALEDFSERPLPPHRGCRAAPEQSLPLDGAAGVLVQVDGILQEDGD